MSFLFYIVFSLCCVYACCDEPFGCSQSFTFIEKTLDKVIRTEVKVETIEQRIIETNTAVKTSLDELKLEREETKKETNAAVQSALDELKRKHEETKKETNTTVQSALDELKRKHEETKKETNTTAQAELDELKRKHEETKKETNAAVQSALDELKRKHEETKKETNTAVQAALEELKRERAEIKKEKDDLEEFFKKQKHDLERKREETMKDLENQRSKNEEKMTELFKNKTGDLERQREYVIKQLATEIDNIKKTLTTPTVLFKARTLSDLSVQKDQVLIFTKNMLNYGDGYDNKTGVFTASVSGTYLFTFQLCVFRGSDMYYGLVHNGNVHTAGDFYDSSSPSCYTADGMLYLEVGDTVSIKCLFSSANLFENTKPTYSYENWNTFSGMLIHQ